MQLLIVQILEKHMCVSAIFPPPTQHFWTQNTVKHTQLSLLPAGTRKALHSRGEEYGQTFSIRHPAHTLKKNQLLGSQVLLPQHPSFILQSLQFKATKDKGSLHTCRTERHQGALPLAVLRGDSRSHGWEAGKSHKENEPTLQYPYCKKSHKAGGDVILAALSTPSVTSDTVLQVWAAQAAGAAHRSPL